MIAQFLWLFMFYFSVCTLITNNTSEIYHYDLCCFLLIGYDEVFIVYLHCTIVHFETRL